MNVRAIPLSVDETPIDGSYSEALRDAFLATAMDLPFFASFMPRLTKALPIEPADLPILGCYLGMETMRPDGDWNAGPLAFIVNVNINWSIMIAESAKEEAERRLQKAYVALIYGLFTNAALTSFLDTTDYVTGLGTRYNARFEGVMNQRAVTSWGAPFLNNETPVAELQYEQVLQYRRVFDPVLIHDLQEVHITTSFPVFRTEAEREAIQQVRQLLVFPVQPPAPRRSPSNG